jgi:hypothetical protein
MGGVVEKFLHRTLIVVALASLADRQRPHRLAPSSGWALLGDDVTRR